MLRKMVLSKLKSNFYGIQLRCQTQLATKQKENVEDKMLAWQIHSYGALDELKLSNVRIPLIAKPTDVLVKVQASSVNTIDVAMADGYGATLLNVIRKAKVFAGCTHGDTLEFPLTLGRDFSGIIVSKGHGVGNKFKLGDEVWGVIPVDQQGCHAHYVVLNSNLINKRPKNLSYIEAASILYAGLTAWSALWLTGGLCYKTALSAKSNRRVLVLGGSGGVGTIAVQLLKIWNAHVVTTCSSDAINILQKLGADVVADYNERDTDSKIISEGPYDIILDCCNQGIDTVRNKGYPHKMYITLNSPVLRNIDQHGLVMGSIRNISDLIKFNMPKNTQRSIVKWGFFVPSRKGIEMLGEYAETGQLLPVIDKVYPFQELPAAYQKVTQGHLRGKVVIDMTKCPE